MGLTGAISVLRLNVPRLPTCSPITSTSMPPASTRRANRSVMAPALVTTTGKAASLYEALAGPEGPTAFSQVTPSQLC